ncbi:MAG: hemerythrin domain-containing protein [Burkholderiales bacterium]
MKHSELEESTRQALPQGNQSKPAMQKAHKKPADAIALLKADHKEVSGLLKQYESADGNDEKEVLARQICEALTVHAQVEEEIFYPAVRKVLDEDDQDLLDEADVEHGSIKQLVADVERASPADDDHYDAKVTVIGEYVKHHVREEEKELFPKVQRTGLDTKAIDEQLAARKAALMARLDG